jgi:O-antigen/teichoic acid export membrane protein
MLVSSFLVVIQRSDLILVGAMIGPEEAGIYNAASRTAALVSFILSAVNAIAAPTIAKLYAEEKHNAMKELAKKIAQYVFWPSFIISLVLVLGSGFILSLFGSEFVEGKTILIILIVGQLVNASVGSVGYFMNMTGNQDQSAKVFGVSAVINILLNIVGIYLYGAVGAAVATAISMMIWNLWLYVLVKKNLNIDSSIFSTFKR